MTDLITILRSPHLTLAKVWKSDGTIEPYSRAKFFQVEQVPVEGIEALSVLLTKLESDPHACIIRGRPNENAGGGQSVRRLIENFEDAPLHMVLIEVDEFTPLISDPLTEPLDSIQEFIREVLPVEFHDASFHWQLSNSAGAQGKAHLLKAHCWFWLETPQDSATLRAWVKSLALKFDLSVLNPVQIHFTSNPIFESGRTDPITKRSGFHRGERDDVPLAIDISDLDIKAQGVRQRGETRTIEDPQADWIEANHETWGTLANGGILVSCPFEEEHSGGGRGDSSSVYFPAGTNSYSEGRWVCLHNSCRDRPQEEFSRACGFAENRLAMLAEPLPQINGKHLNGHPIEEDLPWFNRDGKGLIKVTMDNLHRAIAFPKACGMDIRMDTFREEIMWAEPRSGQWQAFRDEHYVDLRVKLEHTGFTTVSHEAASQIVYWQACKNSFDTARAWLDSLVWDGVPRIERFWIDHFGVLDDNFGYAKAVGAYSWTALAGRVLHPGVQADMAPILTGAQGLGKSRGVAAMAPVNEFATTMSFHEPEVERARKMRGTLVVELAELQGLKSRDREEILAWMTRSIEHWTPKFKEMSKTFHRRFVMFATTNDEDFLDDPSGERRWLPIACGRREGFEGVDQGAIHAIRDQLWAEGRERFLLNGVEWEDAERLARREHALYKSDDLWQEAVRRWLVSPDMGGQTPMDRDWLTTFDVAEGALSMPAKTVKYSDQRRIAKVLKDEGFKDVVRSVDGKPKKVWAPRGLV